MLSESGQREIVLSEVTVCTRTGGDNAPHLRQEISILLVSRYRYVYNLLSAVGIGGPAAGEGSRLEPDPLSQLKGLVSVTGIGFMLTGKILLSIQRKPLEIL
jgi:hypothetical protein